MTLIARIKPRAQREIEQTAEWWAENRPTAQGAVRNDIEAALALLVENPESAPRLKQRGLLRFAGCTLPEFDIFSTIESVENFSKLSHSGMLAVKQARQSKEMLPNPSFERDAAKERRPSTLRWALR